ncbi:hypothetical protein PFISCL1PPCAC_26490, partial [Pristionchus fissidentatus]
WRKRDSVVAKPDIDLEPYSEGSISVSFPLSRPSISLTRKNTVPGVMRKRPIVSVSRPDM